MKPIRTTVSSVGLLAISAALAFPASASGQCVVPDNGAGTAHLPPVGCTYNTPSDDMRIIDGLPPLTTIEINASLGGFSPPGPGGVCSFPGEHMPGGSLGGGKDCASASLVMPMTGTGTLAGFARNIILPISLEQHTAPRTPGAPVQAFNTEMFRLFGQITGDPDFDLLRVTGGTDFGLPSPGQTTLTQLPGGNWAVDSFFDITYRIDFVGRPGSALAGRSGSTTGTIRFALPDVPGACCNRATGGCAVVPASSCGALGGQFRGGGTTCALVTCAAEGACCDGLICRVVPQTACLTIGRYLGNGTACVCPSGVNPCCAADFNNSGAVSVQDIFDFLEAYFEGCP